MSIAQDNVEITVSTTGVKCGQVSTVSGAALQVFMFGGAAIFIPALKCLWKSQNVNNGQTVWKGVKEKIPAKLYTQKITFNRQEKKLSKLACCDALTGNF